VVVLFGAVVFIGAPYVPSHKNQLRKSLDELYRLKKTDVLLDIGSGDGLVLREVSRRGARAVGYEINPFLAALSRILSWGDRRVSVRVANFWASDFPDDTTIVYTFGDSRDIERMAEKVSEQAKRLGRPLYFMSYAFKITTHKLVKSNKSHYLYRIVP